jgi:hypothetical protein
MFFRPDQYPRAVFPRELSDGLIGAIMTSDSVSEVTGVPDVEMASWILKDRHPKHKGWLQR